jgi:hypothetical protein
MNLVILMICFIDKQKKYEVFKKDFVLRTEIKLQFIGIN